MSEVLPARSVLRLRRARATYRGRDQFDAFRAHFQANALAIQGSGWSILGWDSLGQRPLIFQLYDQQGNVPAGVVPLVLLDMWEHAFYLQYRNVKADYVTAWWNVVDWSDAAARFQAASSQTPGLITP
ncbi:superoxide dismutase [Pseudonocardia sp.]|uniref:superoxide dismutase n=1 Tax=Pseudonocardia sp. TaxID=60912 RepID=UPI0039C9BC9A